MSKEEKVKVNEELDARNHRACGFVRSYDNLDDMLDDILANDKTGSVARALAIIKECR